MNAKLCITKHRIGAGRIGSIAATIALCLTLVATLSATSVSGTIVSQSAAAPLVWGSSAHSLQLSLSSTNSVYRYGDLIRVNLGIRNMGSSADILRTDFWQEYSFEIHRADGTLVQRLAVPRMLDSSTGQIHYVLKRGSIYQTQLNLGLLFDLNPGDYSVQASSMIRPYNENTREAAPGTYWLTSNVLHIHVQ
jgi:hypothetical protein